MRRAILPLPQYALMAWRSVKKAKGELYLLRYIRSPSRSITDVVIIEMHYRW